GDRDDVGRHVVVLEGEERPGAPESGLDLVAEQQGAVLVQDPARLTQVAGGRYLHALALDGLDDEGGDAAASYLPREGVEVAEGHHRVWQKRREAAAELPAAIHGQGPRREAVEGVVAVDDPGPARGAAGELQGGLDGLRAAVAEVDPLEAGHPCEQLL